MDERLYSIRGQLEELLTDAKADPEGLRLVSLAENRQGERFSGKHHNAGGGFTTHLHQLCAQLEEQNDMLQRVYGLSTGDGAKMSSSVPTSEEFSRLVPFLTDDATFTLFDPGVRDRYAHVPLRALHPAYEAYPKPEVINEEAPMDDLARKTPLISLDRSMLASIIAGCREHPDITGCMLTGSASGRGGPKGVVNRYSPVGLPYKDLDVVITTNAPQESYQFIKKTYQHALQAHDFPVGIEEDALPTYRGEPEWEGNFRRELIPVGIPQPTAPDYQRDMGQPLSIDFGFGYRLDEVMTDDYLRLRRYIALYDS